MATNKINAIKIKKQTGYSDPIPIGVYAADIDLDETHSHNLLQVIGEVPIINGQVQTLQNQIQGKIGSELFEEYREDIKSTIDDINGSIDLLGDNKLSTEVFDSFQLNFGNYQSQVSTQFENKVNKEDIRDEISLAIGQDIAGSVSSWLQQNITTGGSDNPIVYDHTLSTENAAAEAKAVGDNFNVFKDAMAVPYPVAFTQGYYYKVGDENNGVIAAKDIANGSYAYIAINITEEQPVIAIRVSVRKYGSSHCIIFTGDEESNIFYDNNNNGTSGYRIIKTELVSNGANSFESKVFATVPQGCKHIFINTRIKDSGGVAYNDPNKVEIFQPDSISNTIKTQTYTKQQIDAKIPLIDNTLTQSEKPADAKVVGDNFNILQNAVAVPYSVAFTQGWWWKVQGETATETNNASYQYAKIEITDNLPIIAVRVSTRKFGSSYGLIFCNNMTNNMTPPNSCHVIEKLLSGAGTGDNGEYESKYYAQVPQGCTHIIITNRIKDRNNQLFDDGLEPEIELFKSTSLIEETQQVIENINSPIRNNINSLFDMIGFQDIIVNSSFIEKETLSPIETVNAGISNKTNFNQAEPKVTTSYQYQKFKRDDLFYKISTYINVPANTDFSQYNYPYYILGVDQDDHVIDAYGKNELPSGQREFYIKFQESVVYFYVNCYINNDGQIVVKSLFAPSITTRLDSNYEEIEKLKKENEHKSTSLEESEKNALKKILILNKENRCLNFGFITDTHANQYQDAKKYISVLRHISKTNILDDIFHGGDVITTYADTYCETFDDYVQAMLNGLDEYNDISNIIFIEGNHDNGHDNNDINLNNIDDNASRIQYSLLFGSSMNSFTKNPDDLLGQYGFKDYPNVKIRIIILESFNHQGGQDENGTSNDNDVQLNWLRSTLLNTPQDYNVLILTHYFIKSKYQQTNRLLKYFNEADDVFAGNAQGRLIGVICGHKHNNLYQYDTNEAPNYHFNVINVLAGYNGCDIFSIDTENKRIYETTISDLTDPYTTTNDQAQGFNRTFSWQYGNYNIISEQ